MTITKTVNGTEATLAVSGWLDTQAAPQLEEAVNGLGDGIESLTIDLSALEYISSSGVRQIVAAYKKMNGQLLVKNAPEGIMNIFHTAGIDKKIHFG